MKLLLWSPKALQPDVKVPWMQEMRPRDTWGYELHTLLLSSTQCKSSWHSTQWIIVTWVQSHLSCHNSTLTLLTPYHTPNVKLPSSVWTELSVMVLLHNRYTGCTPCYGQGTCPSPVLLAQWELENMLVAFLRLHEHYITPKKVHTQLVHFSQLCTA